jgi:hypothetical protein
VKAVQAELSHADGMVSDYLGGGADPGLAALSPDGAPAQAGTAGLPQDVALMALQRADDSVRKRADDAQNKFDQAQLALTMVQQSTPSGFRLVDRPLPPDQPVSRSKQLLAAGVGGVVTGLLLSGLTLTALTAADTSLRYAGEVEAALGLRLVGTVQHLA